MGQVIHLHERHYVGLGIDKTYAGLKASDEIIAKVLRISEVSRIARTEAKLREFVEAKWELRQTRATKKAIDMAKRLKSADQIAAAIDAAMRPWATDVTAHFIREQAHIYKLARVAGFKKATRQTTAPLTYDSPNATELKTGEPVKPNTQVEAERAAGKKIPIIKAAKVPKMEVLPAFDVADEAAISAMNKQQTFWIGKHYDKNVAGSIRETTRGAMLEAGKDRVAAGVLMAERVKNTLRHVITPAGFVGTSKQYFEGLAANAATVARVQGQMRSFADIGISRYTISNPGGKRTCSVCLHLDGKTFSLQQGLSQMHTDMAADTPDAMKAAHPWNTSKQTRAISPTPGRLTGAKDSAALSKAGMSLPPYHFRCRCTVDISSEPGVRSFDNLLPFTAPTPAAAAMPALVTTLPGVPTKAPIPAVAVPVSVFDQKAMAKALANHKASDVAGSNAKNIRIQMNNLLKSHNLNNADDIAKRVAARQYGVKSLAVADAEHGWDGAINMKPEMHSAAKQFFVKGVRTQDASYGARVLIHEAIHGTSPMRNAAYQGGGLIVEEVTTELAARHVLQTTFKLTAEQVSAAGAYDITIGKVKSSIYKNMGYNELRGGSRMVDDAMTKAALRMRNRKKMREVANMISDPDEYVNYFVKQINSPPGTTKKVAEAARKKIAAEVKKINPEFQQ